MNHSELDSSGPAEAEYSEVSYAAEAGETLMEKFEHFYRSYRKTAGTDVSFTNAYEALVLSLLGDISRHADTGDLEAIRSLTRQWKEIRFSIQGSNDSVKEKFERSYDGREKTWV